MEKNPCILVSMGVLFLVIASITCTHIVPDDESLETTKPVGITKITTLYDDDDLDNIDNLIDSDEFKRSSLFRFGKRGSLMRFGKRGSLFRFGKRGSLFRFGRAGPVPFTAKRTLLRWGKRLNANSGYRLDEDNINRLAKKNSFHWGRETDE